MKMSKGVTSNSNLILSTDSDLEANRLILLLIIGVGTALKKRIITIDDAETFLFSPFSMLKLKKIGIKKTIIDIIQLGAELEDVESLIPHCLDESIEDIINFSLTNLNKLPKVSRTARSWLKDLPLDFELVD